MNLESNVAGHYAHGALAQAIDRALVAAGKDPERLTPADLGPIDEFHIGGGEATAALFAQLGLQAGMRWLDIGSGLGGSARHLAAAYGCIVSGIDLAPEYVEVAGDLARRVGLQGRVDFRQGSALALPFPDAGFDGASLLHVGMNIPDKTAVFAEVHRVLRPGGRFALYEQMRTGDGDLPYPLPWAEDERSSFVETVADYRAHLVAAGFTVEDVEDCTPTTLGPPPQGPVSNAVIFGPPFVHRIGNNVAATKAGLLGAWLVLARA